MGQQEVYSFLLKNKNKWVISKEIANSLNCSVGSVTNSLKKLRKTNYIKFKNKVDNNNTYLYQAK
jgi:predicted transcriptional regulator